MEQITHAIVAIDPGVSTGVVVAHVYESGEVEIISFDQFVRDNPYDTAESLIEIVTEPNIEYKAKDVVVVCEQFDLRPGNKFVADLTPVKINSVIEYWVRTERSFSNMTLHMQTPAQAKRLVSNETLKNLGWYPTGKDVGYRDANDVRDAFRHLVYYLVKTEKNLWVTKQGWPKF